MKAASFSDRAKPPAGHRAGAGVPPTETAAFLTAIPPFAMFASIGNPDVFRPLPDGWTVGVADVVGSTAAIAEGRYKAVNTAGASVISAVSNALGTLDFPYLFAGDGASFAVAPQDAGRAAQALASTVPWVERVLGLTLRAGTVTVGEVRRHEVDVRIARFAASGDASYAMFAGGGLRWAEAELKAGRLTAPRAEPDAHPDLTGLSCRFQDLKSRHGVILSVMVRPAVDPADPRFRTLIADILTIAGRGSDDSRPVPVFKPLYGVSPKAIAANGRIARRPGEGKIASWLRSAKDSAVASVMMASGASVGGFSAPRYLAEVMANTDFRKYDDGLMMTLDCAEDLAASIEARLAVADEAGVARFGLHRQAEATLTCVVPSVLKADHVHFIDGAAGGYAMAAQSLGRAQPLAPGKGV